MKNFTVLLPPPNITGSLHIGHYFNWLLQDFLIQYKKKQGYETKWILGLDHAGIGTQYIVENQLAKENLSREQLGKEKFIQKIWEWKEEAEKLIEEQVNNFEFDMNWQEKHFTMEEEHQERVKDAFIKFYNDGLIQKKLKITNWDTKFQTAISDLEVVEKIEKQKIYLIEYKSADKEKSIWVATTRPETIFADTALCLNPNDERAKELEGKNFLIPIINKQIPVIIDELCKIDKGVGVLKVTPAHDFLDYEIGQKHNLDSISIINKKGQLYNTIPELDGMTVECARKEILKIFDDNKVKFKIQDWEGIKKYTEKSQVAVESILTEQWFLDVSKMAQEALIKSERTKFYPSYIKNTFEYWMKNIKPWCISRQIWWGHQIPIWYTEDNEVICARNFEEAQKKFPGKKLVQETDVLDTWFSSALWANLIEDEFDTLITGKDILFFWVARMMMFSLYLYKKSPFKNLYFNGIVRDKNNDKMSKTKGNVINPVEINKKYGNDALRFTLLKNATNKDIKLNEKDVEISRNFITKIINAEKFLKNFLKKSYKSNLNLDNWIENSIINSKFKIDQAIENYNFQLASDIFQELFKNKFCDWYIEGLKTNPSEKAFNYFYTILEIGVPFIPITIEKILPKNYNFKPLIEKQSDFEKIIQIVKFLRKIKKHTKINSFYSNFEGEIIEGYTKLTNDKTNCSFFMNLEGEKIYINKIFLKEIYLVIEKELNLLEKDFTKLKEKIDNSKNVPDEILNEWKKNLRIKNDMVIEINKWHNSLP